MENDALIIYHGLDRIDIISLLRGLVISSEVAIKLNLFTKYKLGHCINHRFSWADVNSDSWKYHTNETLFRLYKVLKKTINYEIEYVPINKR